VIGWLKRMFESESRRTLRESRKYLHENRNEMQKSIATSRQSGKKSSEALRVAEHALNCWRNIEMALSSEN
jgi:hypothetical protein